MIRQLVFIIILCLISACGISGKPIPKKPSNSGEKLYCKLSKLITLDSDIANVEVFIDYECRGCRKIGRVLRDLKKRFPKHININLFHYPLDNKCNRTLARPLHQNACLAAQYVLCAGAQDLSAYWRLHNKFLNLFDFHTSSLNLAVKESRVNLSELKACLARQDAAYRIKNNIEEGIRRGVNGTPRIFVNGVQIPVMRASMLESFFEALFLKETIDCA